MNRNAVHRRHGSLLLRQPKVQAVDIDIIPLKPQACDLAAWAVWLTKIGEKTRGEAKIIAAQIAARRGNDRQTGGPCGLNAIFRIFDRDTKAKIALQLYQVRSDRCRVL